MISQDMQPFPRRAPGDPHRFRGGIAPAEGYRRGDVARFQRWMVINSTSGSGVYGRWKPRSTTNTGSVSVENGCLVLTVSPVAGTDLGNASAAQTVLAGDFDVVLALSVQMPRDFPSSDGEQAAAGIAMVDSADANIAIGVSCDDARHDHYQVVTKVQTWLFSRFLMDAGVADLPTTQEAGIVPRSDYAAGEGFLLRAKRLGASGQLYYSRDGGCSWQHLGPNVPAALNTNSIKLLIFGWAAMGTPAGSMKVICSGMKFLDPRLPLVP